MIAGKHEKMTLAETALSLLDGPLFTFTVGCGGENTEDIVVHSKIISEHSGQLCRLMGGSFNEAQIRHARLEDVDISTFKRFRDFVYLRAYKDPEPEQWKNEDAGDGTESPSQISRQEISHPVLDLRTEEPVDSHERLKSAPEADSLWDGWGDSSKTSSLLASKKGKKIPMKGKPKATWLFESPSTPYVVVAESDSIIQRKQNAKSGFKALNYGEDMFPNSYPSLVWPAAEHDPSRNMWPVFLGHAKVYVFAEQRIIPRLRVYALRKMHLFLKEYTPGADRLLAILDLIDYVFENIPGENVPSNPDGKTYQLRSMLVRFVIANMTTIGPSGLFADFLSKGGDFVSLFWITLHRSMLVEETSQSQDDLF